MVTKRKKGTAINILSANVETEEFVRIPVFIRKCLKSQKAVDKIARTVAEENGVNFIKAEFEHVVCKYTMEDEEFFKNAKEEIE